MNEHRERIKELVDKINDDLRSRFYGNDFGGELLYVYLTERGENAMMLSMIFRATQGGKHSFIIKGKLDFVEEVMKQIAGVDNFVEIAVQVLKEDEPFTMD